MKISLVAIGKKMPYWVNVAYQEYAKRLPKEFSLELIEVAAIKRGKHADTAKVLQQEGDSLLAALPSNNQVIALERSGIELSSQDLAKQLQRFQHDSQNISLLIGGPEGLSEACLQRAQHCWSLSKLTMPHPIVRLLIAEQIYRAWSILTQHPYHK